MQLRPVSSGLLQHLSSGFLCSPAHGNVRTAAQAGGQKFKDNNFLQIYENKQMRGG